jgi:H+/Cl- antiporter ClcA
LLVACGAGAGMAAAYGVPLGGALFALEVLRGVFALRLILPALLASAIAAGVSWLALPNAPTYVIPMFPSSTSVVCWALVAGPIAGLVSIGYVHLVAWADRNKPEGWRRLIAPAVALGLVGATAIEFPQVLGNGKDITQPAFSNEVAPWLLLTLFVLKPLSTILCLGSGVPSGLFTPSLALGAFVRRSVGSCLVLDLARRAAWSLRGPGRRSSAGSNDPRTRLRCRLGDGTDGSRPVVRPLLLAVVTATVVARTLDPRSIYDARLTKRQIENLQQERKPPSM